MKLKFEAIDTSTYLSKIQLANQVGSGWPDVLFDPQPNDVASLQSPLFNFTQNLDKLVPADVQKDFATENSLCKIDGHLYCLQNDLAQDVLWYNKPLLEQFGYSVPTTWDEYQRARREGRGRTPRLPDRCGGELHDLLRVPLVQRMPAADGEEQHRGRHQHRGREVHPRRPRLLDPLIENGSVSRMSPFDPGFAKEAQDGKLLMLPAASWFGEYMFKPETGFHFAAGSLAAAPMPTLGWREDELVRRAGRRHLRRLAALDEPEARRRGRAVRRDRHRLPEQLRRRSPRTSRPRRCGSRRSRRTRSTPKTRPRCSSTRPPRSIPPTSVTRYDVDTAFTNTVVAAVSAATRWPRRLPTLQTQLAEPRRNSGLRSLLEVARPGGRGAPAPFPPAPSKNF